MARKRYLKKTSLKEAQHKFLTKFADYELSTEIIKTSKTKGRVNSKAIYAKRSSPDFYASAMDGIAVRSESTNYASERDPVLLKKDDDFIYVDTGDLIPDDFNAVIKIEDVVEVDQKTVEIIKSIPIWNNIRSIGESVIKKQMLVPTNTEIGVFEIGAMLEAGVVEVEVYKRPQISVIPTGSELVKPEDDLKKGDLIDFNSTMIDLLLKESEAIVKKLEIVKDDYQIIKEKIIRENKENDLTIILAGSSAGKEDYTLKILSKLGKIILHGVDIMPGKPLILAEVNNKPVVGLPGYPLSALLDFHLFIEPLIKKWYGQDSYLPEKINAKVLKKVPSTPGLKEFIRVNIANIEERLVAIPQKRGSASMNTLINADGLLPIGESKEGIRPNSISKIYLLKNKKALENQIMMIGSHDLSIDILRDLIRKRRSEFDFKIQSVGSMSGLISLKRGECHLAGSHLLDPVSGEYNVSYLDKFFSGQKLAIINFVYRDQGFIVKKGNPKSIKSIGDLVKKDLKYINRQAGSGTRVLFDYLLDKNNIDCAKVNGYDKEEVNHISAAIQVTRGRADTAMGIKSAAVAVGADFVPIKKEKYDIILKEELLDDLRIKEIIKIIKSNEFKKEVNTLGGYDTSKSGSVIVHS
ncbi:MAG: molybdopterin biosynthesis protein [Halanaerobiales bacterium]|nr:molybdopterin biosynthesis protein [Halanaerobiales bacterium]